MTYSVLRSSGIFLLSLLFLFLLSINISYGLIQVQPYKVQSSLLPQKLNKKSSSDGSEQLKILGVMVEFLPDTNRFTSGNGTFGPASIPYLENPGTNIDALPHDKNYFEAHLEFSKNYFETISNGKISIDFDVLPKVYTLNHSMDYYSPVGEHPDLSKIADFVKDVWTLIGKDGSLPVTFNQAENVAFVIFHAGVGRDIELTGTTLDKTPLDLPSLYLSKTALSEYLSDPSFSGFPIDNGNLLVNNSLVVPRTLTRAGDDAAGNRYILPLSINGLLTAEIGNHLGLPDLFNTETGNSGIGRFGLMDGAGIFAYNGLFPPEPSAWEKIYLGWESPFTVNYDDENPVSLPATSLHQEQSIAKIPISDDEYFLIENRHRDPDGNGVILTIKKSDGTYVEQSFTNDDTEFTNQESGFDELLEPGVVVNVSNYDFSLPGGLRADSDGPTELNGGILIWHVDEAVIQSKINRGGINNDSDRKGVNLQEADGAQDIGKPTTIGFSQNEVNGSPYDFWWSRNSAQVITPADTIRFYENRFGPDTYPDNNSNSGAPSYFELYDFSDNLPEATFKIRPVNPYSDLYEVWDSKSDPAVTTVTDASDEYWKRYPLAIQSLTVNQKNWIVIPGADGIQFYQPGNKSFLKSLVSLPSVQQPFIDVKGELLAVAENPLQTDNDFSITTYRFDGNDFATDSTYIVLSNSAFISSFEDEFIDIDGTNNRIYLNNNQIIQTTGSVQYSDRAGDYQSRIEDGTLILNFPGETRSFPINKQYENERVYTGLFQNETNEYTFYLLEDGKLSLISPDNQYQTKRIIYESDFIDWPAFADFNGNGKADILFVDKTKNQLIAKNSNGTFLSSFPISAPQNITFTGTPLIADLNGDEGNELLITGYDNYSMNLFAYNEDGELLKGFPLLVGGIQDANAQPIHPLITDDNLIAVSHVGDFKVWKFPNIRNVQWRSKYGNQTTNKVTGFIEFGNPPEQQFSLLNNKETYNWPNPAKDETQLRFQTSKSAKIKIKILTMSGRLIGEHSFQSRGGVPEEFVINTSSWASGGYFALVEAKADGVTERKLVKIAIVR